MKALQFVTISFFALAALVGSAEDRTGQPEMLTIDAAGQFCNSGVVENVEAFMSAKAQERVTEVAANLAHDVGTNCLRIVNEGIAEVQRGAKIEYSDGFIWSIGAFQISTNAACNIVNLSLKNSTTRTIDGEPHFAADFFYYFTEDIGSYLPGIKYSRNFNGTNSWVYCETDEPVGPISTNITQSLHVDYAYTERVWVPTAYQQAFFKVFVDSGAAGTGTTIEFEGNIKNGFTGDIQFQLAGGQTLTLHVEQGLITSWEVN